MRGQLRRPGLLTGGPDLVEVGSQGGGVQLQLARLRLAVEQDKFSIGDETVPLTVSVGVALYQPEDRNFADMLRRADKALYLAKSLGRNRVELAG